MVVVKTHNIIYVFMHKYMFTCIRIQGGRAMKVCVIFVYTRTEPSKSWPASEKIDL